MFYTCVTNVHTHTHTRVVGGAGTLRLPPWGGDHGACLMDYVPLVHKLLSDRVDSIIQSYVRRKEYMAGLLSLMGRSVLEYDTEGFKKVAFLFEQQGFSFVAHRELFCVRRVVYIILWGWGRVSVCVCVCVCVDGFRNGCFHLATEFSVFARLI